MAIKGGKWGMKKYLLKYSIILLAVIALRYAYVLITRCSFFDGVFIASIIGLICGIAIIDAIANKRRK